MPLFEFECQDCEKVVEVLLRTSHEEAHCPTCNGKRMKKQLSVIATPSIAGRNSAGPCETNVGTCGRPQCGTGGCMFGN